MKTDKKKRGITQLLDGHAYPGTAEALRPNAVISKKPGKSEPTARGSDADITRLISEATHEQIAERAKAIWVQRGRLAGQDLANWYEAEAQLRIES